MKFNYLKRGLLALLLCAGFATTSLQANAAQLTDYEYAAVNLFLDLVRIESACHPKDICCQIAVILQEKPGYHEIRELLIRVVNMPKLRALAELKKAHQLLPAHLRDYMRQHGPRDLETTVYQMRLVKKFSCWQ